LGGEREVEIEWAFCRGAAGEDAGTTVENFGEGAGRNRNDAVSVRGMSSILLVFMRCGYTDCDSGH
jgi:hypothetical protein